MRFFQIAVFLLVFNSLAAVTVQIGWFGDAGYQPVEEGLQQKEDIEQGYQDVNTVNQQQGILGDLNFLVENVRNIIASFSIFIDVFSDAVLVKPVLKNVMCSGQQCSSGGAVMDFINAIQTFILLLYVVGGVQFVAGRSFKNIQ